MLNCKDFFQLSYVSLPKKQCFRHQRLYGKFDYSYIKLCSGVLFGITITLTPPVWSIPKLYQNPSFSSLSYQVPEPETFIAEFTNKDKVNSYEITSEINKPSIEPINLEFSPFLVQNNSESNPIPETESMEESNDSNIGGDPELGILRLRELPKPPDISQPKLYLLGNVGYLFSNNLFSLVDPVEDNLFSGGLTLLLTQRVDPRTSISASVGGSVIRYVEETDFDYNQMRLNLGLRRQFTKTTYGEFGWTNQQLFSQSDGDRFLNDHAIYATIGRKDQFSKKVFLDSYYQFRRRFADPGDRSQTVNSLGVFLGYNPSDSVGIGLGYNLSLSDFVEGDRFDNYHQVLARLTYSINQNSRIYLFGGRSFGGSTNDNIDFDSWLFGVGIDFHLNLF